MEYYVKSVVPIIESNYDKFTPVEKQKIGRAHV